jgi:peptide/nickel transport system substrate-binding protein
MVANKDWWDKNPGNVTELSYLPIKSAPTRVAALLSGDVDIVTDLPPQDFFKLKEEGKVRLLEGSEIRTVFFVMDQGSEELRESSVKGKNPFKDKRVREALNLALDREAIKRSIMRGLSVPAALMIAPGVNGYDAALDAPLKPDLDKAFCAEAAKAGLVNLEGHRSVGGMRASIYNAMPYAGVEKLVEFMKEFAKNNPKK